MKHSNEVIKINAINNTCQHCRALKLCLADALDTAERKKFSDAVLCDKSLVHGEYLFWPDDPLRYVYIIHSGSFKTYIENENGETQITGFYFQGDILGLDSVAENLHNCGAVALETSTVCKIPLPVFEKILGQDPTFARTFINRQSRDIILKQNMLFALGKMNAEQKVADFLIHISGEYEVRGYSSTAFSLSMKRSDIANYLGLAAETISRIFKGFQDIGYITVDRRKISIENFSALKSPYQYESTDQYHIHDRVTNMKG